MSKDKKPKNPKNPISDKQVSNRVNRGGAWFNDPFVVRPALSGGDGPSNRRSNYAFRIVKNIPKDPKDKK